MQKTIHLITGNPGKLLAAQKAFSKYNIQVNQIDTDYPEIQAMNSAEIAKHTAIQAAKDHQVIVVREDHSMFIPSLGGFPGPYTSYFDKTMPVEILLKMLSNFQDRNAEMELAAAIAFPNGNIKEFSYRVPLKLADSPKGDKRNWDKILMLAEGNKTFSETNEEENVDVWLKNYDAIGEYLTKES